MPMPGYTTDFNNAGSAFFQGILNAKLMRLAQQQQDLEQSKYETAKQQQAVTNAQKERELNTTEEQAIGQSGTDPYYFVHAMQNRSASPQSQAQQQAPDSDAAQVSANEPDPSQQSGPGMINNPPGGGLMGASQSAPNATIPTTTVQANPGVSGNQPGYMNIPSLMVRQAKMAQLKEAQDMALKLKSAGGSADVVDDGKGGYTLANVQQGPQVQGEVNNLQHGGRSAENAVNTQYNEDTAVKTARGSQVNMAQMLDAYKNPSPYADASLVLNAFKIKNPSQAPDVNSLEEMSKSQAVPDQWKALANKAISGTFDQPTRDNIMRDAMSAFRGNTDSLTAEQQKFIAKAKNANVNPSLITAEPAIQNTRNEVNALQSQIGPYVPPAQRGGLLGSISKMLSSSPPAIANQAPPPGMNFQQFQAWKRQNSGK